MNYLDIKDIKMNYHSQKGITEALKDINFAVNEGDFVSIIGPSGCGKSTLLNIIASLISPSSGKILYKNEDISLHKDVLGYMFQKDNLFEWLTIWENICLGLKIKKNLSKDKKQELENMLNIYGLSSFKKHHPSELSGGMRQRAALIRTLALSPEILLLDEPFSALDYQSRLKVCDEISSIIKHENKTAIMVTHDLSEAISTSSKIVILSKRPSTIKKEVSIDFPTNLSPLERRDHPKFGEYFNILWKELDVNDD
ncbi:ABC transporter ATP-binding protein [Inconstantimicrobium mannanitabidum]|uniref:Spermidine/putrescine ABC transporter ATP-binding protein n=1 Tax=Inconstantimicrobium mannanitabidum TaxID=1604901 RepID=A0ACB5RC60_9CLOT|nr:ABC transporter ATP-binding protein [Clostridium sp. TW13]GKX66818.1 spermidine/putrescine ABC transporter ATP-binding protein [Clostridium sp. TW13]